MKDVLTDRQNEILEFIKAFINLNGFPPTYREIGNHFEIASTFGVKRHVDALVKKGFITTSSNSSRSFNVVGQITPSKEMDKDNLIGIPVVGRVAAGHPILAIENIEDKLYLDPRFTNNKTNCFALKVRGDSMINAGIFDGDYVIVHPQKFANNNDIVVALLEDDATMKRYVTINNRICLIPENDKYPIIEVNNREDFSIVGKVLGVFRFYN